MRFTLMVSLVISICAAGGSLERSSGMAWAGQPPEPSASRAPLVVEVWPDTPPDESGNIGEEKVRMSPKLDRKQVEVTEPTRLITNVTKPTLTIYRPAKEKDTGTAVLHMDAGMRRLAAVSGIPQAAGENALSQRAFHAYLSLSMDIRKVSETTGQRRT